MAQEERPFKVKCWVCELKLSFATRRARERWRVNHQNGSAVYPAQPEHNQFSYEDEDQT